MPAGVAVEDGLAPSDGVAVPAGVAAGLCEGLGDGEAAGRALPIFGNEGPPPLPKGTWSLGELTTSAVTAATVAALRQGPNR